MKPEEKTEAEYALSNQLRREMEQYRHQLVEVQGRLDSMDKRIDLLFQKVDLATKIPRLNSLERIRLASFRAARLIAIFFVLLLIGSAVSLTLSLAGIAETLAELSFLFVTIDVVVEIIHIRLSRESSPDVLSSH